MIHSPQSIVAHFPELQSSPIDAAMADPDFSGNLPALSTLGDLAIESLIPLASAFSISPVSGFNVGAVALGASGQIYLGANMEFLGMPLNASLHAEQSAILNAWMHGEPAIEALYISALPCGHCRQFLCELPSFERIAIHVGQCAYQFNELLPHPFTLSRRANEHLMSTAHNTVNSLQNCEDVLHQRAINAAERSYVPYSRTPEGFAINCSDGHTYAGRAAESSAFNPSVPAILSALNLRNFSPSRSYSINRCVQTKLITSLNSSLDFSKSLLKGLTNAALETVSIEASTSDYS
ncbi:MAG: cytidine deaminase [Verrucomicrobiota bacterium]